MLTIYGPRDTKSRFCDGQSRRDFLKIGGMVMGGLALPQLLAAEAQAGIGKSHKAIINIFLPGGPPHQDMWDIKVDAPAEIRGEFQPIKTNVRGIEICEVFPKIAAMADKFVFIRSMVGATGGHDAYQCMTGRSLNPAPAGGWPSAGAWVSKLKGPVNLAIPPHLSHVLQDRPRPLGLRRRRRLPRHGPCAVQARRRTRRDQQDRQHGPQGDHARPARRPQLAARLASTASAAKSMPAARWTASMPSPSRRSASSRRRPWPTRSISPRRAPRFRRSTASATRSSATTARRR